MKKTVSGALAIIAVSAVSTQTFHKQTVNIDTSKVDNDIKDVTKNLISSNKLANKEIFGNLSALVEHVKKDNKNIGVDIASLKAYTEDSTNVYGGATAGNLGSYNYRCYTNCYSNCHRACHGSRGWR